MSAVDLTKKAGFDIETPEFWRSSLQVFARQAEALKELVDDLL
jgi:oligoendopeptidase F